MSQKNVEIVRRLNEAGQRSLAAYRNNPRSGAAALEAGNLDPDGEEALNCVHPEVESDPALSRSPVAIFGAITAG